MSSPLLCHRMGYDHIGDRERSLYTNCWRVHRRRVSPTKLPKGLQCGIYFIDGELVNAYPIQSLRCSLFGSYEKQRLLRRGGTDVSNSILLWAFIWTLLSIFNHIMFMKEFLTHVKHQIIFGMRTALSPYSSLHLSGQHRRALQWGFTILHQHCKQQLSGLFRSIHPLSTPCIRWPK